MTFSDILQQQYKLSSDSIHLLLKDAITISFNKKEPIVQEGQRNDYIYFVEKGSIRGFIEREGKEFTLLFAFEGDLVPLNKKFIVAIELFHLLLRCQTCYKHRQLNSR